jgi:hypothetical protein
MERVSSLKRNDILRRTLVVALILPVFSGCSDAAKGGQGQQPASPAVSSSAGSAAPSSTDNFAWLKAIFPDSAEISRAVGYAVETSGEPEVGGAADLRDTTVLSQVIGDSECLGVTAPLEVSTYRAAPVAAVSYGTEPPVTAGVIALVSEDAARVVFDRMADQWRQCSGRTVVRSGGGAESSYKIQSVDITSTILTAVVSLTPPAGGVPVRIERAVGVGRDCVVDVEVDIAEPPADSPPTAEAAAALASGMLNAASTAPR